MPLGVRLRQVVVAAPDLEPAVSRLREELPLAEPYADPGVSAFGLVNAVMALGDTFVEVVAPAREGTAAGRFLERQGPGGYMVIFQVGDLAAARARVAAAGVRIVWSAEYEDIAGIHLHPADVGAAIVSLDQPVPPETWRWAGPAWTGRVPAFGPERVTAAILTAPEPATLASRWAALLGVEAEGAVVPLDGGRVVVERGDRAAFVAVEAAGRRVELAR